VSFKYKFDDIEPMDRREKIRQKILELENVTPHNVDEYMENEKLIHLLLNQLSCLGDDA